MKTKEEILNQYYITSSDLKILFPTMGINQCRKVINDIQEEMKEKKYSIPKTIPRLALTKLVKKKFGI